MMKTLLCLLLLSTGGLGNPVDGNDNGKVPAAEPEELDALLAAKKYEEFSFLMDLGNPELAHSKGENKGKHEAMFNKELERGDIVLTSKQREEARQGINFNRYGGSKWPNGEVPYAISSAFTRSERSVILRGIQTWNNQVRCIKFVPRRRQSDYTFFFNGDGCYSNLGRVGGQQPISLDRNGCIYESTVLHEMDHAIGFSHEQNRSDRDDYIEMLWDNIPQEWQDQYEKNNPRDYGLQATYDYYSVMHYPILAPGTNKKAFNVRQNGIDESRIGNGDGFTEIDLQKINELYC